MSVWAIEWSTTQSKLFIVTRHHCKVLTDIDLAALIPTRGHPCVYNSEEIIAESSDDQFQQLIIQLKKNPKLAMQLEETTDVSIMAQLLYMRYIYAESIQKEECFLSLFAKSHQRCRFVSQWRFYNCRFTMEKIR